MIVDHRTETGRPVALRRRRERYREPDHVAGASYLGAPSGRDAAAFVRTWLGGDAGDRRRRRVATEADLDRRAYQERSAAAGGLTPRADGVRKPPLLCETSR